MFATPERAIAHFQELADAGVQYFLVSINVDDTETLRLFTEEVVPAVHLPAAPAAGTGVTDDRQPA